VRRTVPPSAEIEAQIDQLLAVGGREPAGVVVWAREARGAPDHPDRGGEGVRRLAGPGAMSAGRTISGACATGFVRAGCRPPRGRFQWRSRRFVRRPSPSSPAVPARDQAVAHRAAAGDRDRRVRARVVDARRGVAVLQAGLEDAKSPAQGGALRPTCALAAGYVTGTVT
jgi:hypothetical protein